MEDARRIITTIGHGTSGFAEVEALLVQHRIQTIIDVRSEPYSRRAPDFRKDRLEALTAVAGIGYRWMGDRLGGRPSDPALCRPDGTPDWDRIAASPGFRGALDEVAELATGGTVALLCAEASPEKCHRARRLAPALEGRGFTVHHILPDGSAEAHQPSLFPPDPEPG